MKTFAKALIVASAASLAVATPAPQLGGLPALPVCLTGDLTSSLPAGLIPTTCTGGQACTDITTLLDTLPFLGIILGGLVNSLPAGVGVSILGIV